MAAEKSKLVVVLPLIALWYTSSFFTDAMNKQVQREKPIPITLTCLQFFFGGICSTLLLRVLKLQTFQSLSFSQIAKEILPVTICWTIGFITTNISLGKSAVSFTQSVKATEPLFLVFLSTFIFGNKYSWRIHLSLIPIVLGIALVAATELNFSLSGFISVCIANVCFPMRSLLAKKLVQGKVVDLFNLYYYISWTSFLLSLLAAIAVEGQFFGDTSWMNQSLVTKALGNGVLHYVYNQTSFLILGLVEPLTHSIANTTRRFVLIAAAVVYFGTTLTPLNKVGIALLLLGVGSYVYVSTSEKKPDRKEKK